MAQQDAVYATLVMTDSYLPGAMVLGHSLRDRGARKARLAALVLLENLSLDTITELQTVYDDIVAVQQIVNMQPANLYLMNRPDLISTFTKIELWKQTQYKRIVYLDADMVMLRAPNELLAMETEFAAVPDVGWPDCFNSGMMVLNPNMGDYYALLALAKRGISFDGADQGLLNMHFTEWEKLSFTYNCTPNANYQYVPAYKHFQSSITAIHYIGSEKPWQQGRDFKANSGVYSELLARWWAAYDRHYARPKVTSYDQFVQPRKKVQDYVRGEETIYEPPSVSLPTASTQSSQHSGTGQQNWRRGSGGYQITQPQPQPPPGLHSTAPRDDTGPVERPFGDQPGLDEKVGQNIYQPAPTQPERKWSAPHAQWEPASQPPPPNSKPEAANFPTQQYEMSESKQLFEPPASYPEPPKDMWYSVPQDKPQPQAPPRTIFPWEQNAPKATRVFPKSREPTPPPQEEAIEEAERHVEVDKLSPPPVKGRQPSLTKAIEEAFAQVQRPKSPPRHVFPWESRAPKPTRVFPQQSPPSPPPTTRATTADGVNTPEATVAVAKETPTQSPGTTWDSLNQLTNKWDEDPDITRFMESFNKPRKVPVQVVHDLRDSVTGPPPPKERRTSMKLTDFPTEIERPSLPVTPAPIRRPTYWGGDEQAEPTPSTLPVAKGVPRQDEWVRRFTSQYLPALPDPCLRDIDGVLHLTCQHCGRQNPIIKLEELQRRQSLLMSGGADLVVGTKTPPRRAMPDSQSREEAVEAAMKALNVSHEKPKTPTKPILMKPHFEVTAANETDLADESIVSSAHMNATGTRSPARFNPIVLEGEAASERTNFDNTESSIEDATTERTTATHHSTSTFSYSTSSLSPTSSRTDLREASPSHSQQIDEDLISPKSTTVA